MNLSALLPLPLLCLGLGLIAACLLVPQAEANRKMAVDRDQLKQDLAHADLQMTTNASFLARVGSDPELAERLAQRQTRQIRQGTVALSLAGVPRQGGSAFDMIRVPTPPPVPAYRPPVGWVASICGDTNRQLYTIGLGLFMIATGLVVGPSIKEEVFRETPA